MLLGNQSTLMKCPVRFMAGSASSVEPQLRSNWNQAGRNRNQIYRDQRDADELYGIAPGLYAGHTWLIPQRNGAMASHDNTVFGMTATGTLYGGVTANAPADFDISTNVPAGELVVTVQPGGATATFGLDDVGTLQASLSGVGSSTLGLSTNTPTLGAIASLTILPTSFGLDGSLIRYATGSMTGTTAETGVTVDNVVRGVWSALIANYADTGNAALALQTAGSGGVDYNALWASMPTALKQSLADYVLQAAAVDPIASNVKEMNDEELIGDGSSADKFRSHLVP